MKNKLMILIFFLLIVSGNSLKAGEIIYFAKVSDLTGDVNLVYEFNYVGQHYIEAYKGHSSIKIPFNKIKFLEITSHVGVKPLLPKYSNIYYPSLVTLTSGEKIKVVIRSSWFGGKTEFAEHYNIGAPKIRSIEFLHECRYKKCPLCNTIFYNLQITHCKYCKEKLEDQ